MAEAIDVLVESCGFMESKVEDSGPRREGSRIIERINLIVLALGKSADLAADWILVWQVYRVLEAISGCTDTCEHAGNWVCQDGEGLLSDLIAAGESPMTQHRGGGYCLSGNQNLSVLPQVCQYGTDCSDCGPRPPLNEGTSDFPTTIKVMAWSIAITGTCIELSTSPVVYHAAFSAISPHFAGDDASCSRPLLAVAAFLKFRLVCVTESSMVFHVRSLQLNRNLAVPRFLLDDLPATCLSLYILIVFPHHASVASLTLLLLSISYSLFAFMYHTCRNLSGEDTSLYAELRDAGLTLNEMKGVGMAATDGERSAAGDRTRSAPYHCPNHTPAASSLSGMLLVCFWYASDTPHT